MYPAHYCPTESHGKEQTFRTPSTRLHDTGTPKGLGFTQKNYGKFPANIMATDSR